MALIDPTKTRKLVPEHEPESWFEVRPLTAGDMEELQTVEGRITLSVDLLARLIMAWSYEAPPTRENVERLDVDTFLWLTAGILTTSGVRDDPDSLGDGSSPTSAPEEEPSPTSSATSMSSNGSASAI